MSNKGDHSCWWIRDMMLVYLSNNADVKSWTSKWHYTVAGCGEIKSIKIIQNSDQNAMLYLAVNPDQYILFKHSCFHCRECFVRFIAFIRFHCTWACAFISSRYNVGSLMNKWHWLYPCPLTLLFQFSYTFFKSFHISDCFAKYGGLVNLHSIVEIQIKFRFHSFYFSNYMHRFLPLLTNEVSMVLIYLIKFVNFKYYIPSHKL